MDNNTTQSFLNKSLQDKFLLVLDLPKIIKDTDDTIKIRELQLSVYGAPVPGISIPAVDLPYNGQIAKVSSFSRPAYTPLTVNFTVDNSYTNYWVLWRWLNIINDSKTAHPHPSLAQWSKVPDNNLVPYKKNINIQNGEPINFDYMTTLTIFGLDEYNNRKIQFKYTGSFITDLSEIKYNYRESTEIESSASFSFNQLNVQLLTN